MAESYGRTTPRAPADSGPAVAGQHVVVETDVVRPIDRIRWGPILAGLLTAIVTLTVLTVLGLALGLSAFEPGETAGETIGTSAALWGALSALVAFFLGGWVAARTAAVDDTPNGTMNGLMVGVAAVALVIWMIGAGLGNLLGAVGTNIADIIAIGQEATVSPEDALATAETNYEAARDSAWGTFLGLILALAAAALGGFTAASMGREPVYTRETAPRLPRRGPRAPA